MEHERVARAIASTPREAFLPPAVRAQASLDAPLPIGEGQTISAPHMVAIMCEALAVRPGDRVLEVGGGSGWHAAILARLASPGGRVVSVERHPVLAEEARARLAPLALPVETVVADGSEGWPPEAPYDRISVAAAAPDVPPPLLAQLAPGGTMVIPVGDRHLQRLLVLTKRDDGSLHRRDAGLCAFVPLVGRHGFPPGEG